MKKLEKTQQVFNLLGFFGCKRCKIKIIGEEYPKNFKLIVVLHDCHCTLMIITDKIKILI